MSNSNPIIKNLYCEYEEINEQSRSFSAENVQHFKSILNKIDFSDVIIEINWPNNVYNSCMDRYKKAFDKYFPLKI